MDTLITIWSTLAGLASFAALVGVVMVKFADKEVAPLSVGERRH